MWNLVNFWSLWLVSSSVTIRFSTISLIEEMKVKLISLQMQFRAKCLDGDVSYLLWPWFSFEVLLKLEAEEVLQESRKSLAPLSHSRSDWPVTTQPGPRHCCTEPGNPRSIFPSQTSQMSRTQRSFDSQWSRLSVCDTFVSQLQSSFTILYSRSQNFIKSRSRPNSWYSQYWFLAMMDLDVWSGSDSPTSFSAKTLNSYSFPSSENIINNLFS